ncbi:MAG: VWA-like domain-containing protein [Terracidiphilus sp.]
MGRERAHVLYFDAEVQRVDTYSAGETLHLDPVGGGGTDFGPCFDWLNERGIRPQTLAFLTDLYGTFPDSAPDYPVLWASIGGHRALFGDVIPMHAA